MNGADEKRKDDTGAGRGQKKGVKCSLLTRAGGERAGARFLVIPTPSVYVYVCARARASVCARMTAQRVRVQGFKNCTPPSLLLGGAENKQPSRERERERERESRGAWEA